MTVTQTSTKTFDGKHTIFNCLIGGAAGDGIMSAGMLFSKIITRNSYFCHMYTEYPSLIRGGHNNVAIRVSESQNMCQVSQVDILFAINLETIELHIQKVPPGGAIIFDPRVLRRKTVEDFNRPDISWRPIPLRKLAATVGGAKVIQNTIGVAAIVAMIGLPLEEFDEILNEMFVKKPAIAEINVKAADLGYEYVLENFDEFRVKLEDKDDHGLMVITGNTAVAAGLIAGGISVFVGYPMSPATSLLEKVIHYAEQFDYMAVQAEDEISAVMMAIGANHAGGRAATGTSGGGLSLMVEAIGLSGSAEIPLVVVNVMRPGPSTGLPTWTGQADLLFSVSLGQDTFPRLIIAPGDVEESFNMSAEALNYAEEFQIPVIILTDKWLGTSGFTCQPFNQEAINIRQGKSILLDEQFNDKEYNRYELTDDGISPRAIPGLDSRMIFRSTGNEHDIFGEVDDGASNRIQQMDKRMRKMDLLAKTIPKPVIYGSNPENADITIFSWGSNKGILLDVLNRLSPLKVCFVHTAYVWPFPSEFITAIIDKSKKTVVVEQNFDGQFYQLIRNNCLRDINFKILTYDGRPFDPVGVTDQIRDILEN